MRNSKTKLFAMVAALTVCIAGSAIACIANRASKSATANNANNSISKKDAGVIENESDVSNRTELVQLSEEKLEYEDDECIITSRERTYEEVGDFIQLEYPDAISYPGISKFNVLVSNYPSIAAYCKISTTIGNISASKIDLKKEKRLTYYVPSNFDRIKHDTLLLKFFDENRNLIGEKKVAVVYDQNEKLIQIFEMKIE